jgi:hypothetical protein
MTLLPVADGARLLGIHPKTLHLWLKQAHVPMVAHPTDARIGCVEWERIQEVAHLHGRCLPSPATARPVASAGPTPPLPLHEAPPLLPYKYRFLGKKGEKGEASSRDLLR